ncbi:hypothetical protein AVEN_135479-1 [Araneus ventricosus]|uniref:Secreted protein n=1 Tax=Araneus ventricosus TaxID=182803 RepID=A0A4Y2BFQ7_ARAVE|nr:hypothetical protein AVEN_135479-1 [Araneus ventricosus]
MIWSIKTSNLSSAALVISFSSFSALDDDESQESNERNNNNSSTDPPNKIYDGATAIVTRPGIEPKNFCTTARFLAFLNLFFLSDANWD